VFTARYGLNLQKHVFFKPDELHTHYRLQLAVGYLNATQLGKVIRIR
jgi:hypothetical protein